MVEKKFRCPTEHVPRLVKVYQQLTSLHSDLIDGAFAATKCKRMKVIYFVTHVLLTWIFLILEAE